MKAAVDRLYTFLVWKQRDHSAYESLLSLGERYAIAWDEPVLTPKNFRADLQFPSLPEVQVELPKSGTLFRAFTQ